MSCALNSIMLNCFEEYKYVVELYVVPLNWKIAGCWHSLSRDERASHVTLIRYRYAKPRVAHAPGMPGTFSPPSRVSDPVMHHSTCVTHVPWCMPGSLNSSFLWSRWRRKRSQHSRRMRNQQFYVSGKRPIFHGTELVLLKYSACRSTQPKGLLHNWKTLQLKVAIQLIINNYCNITFVSPQHSVVK